MSFRNRRLGVRLALLAGFGGGLILMAIAGLDSVRGARDIEAGNALITSEYLERHHWLESIRGDLYLSSAIIRDYLLEANVEAAKRQREQLAELRRHMGSALALYASGLQPGEAGLFADLNREIRSYWGALEPIETWRAQARIVDAEQFLKSQVLPRRAFLISIADKIDLVHEKALKAGNHRSAALFRDFRSRIGAMLGLTLGLSAILAAVSVAYILRLEREAKMRYEQVAAAREELKGLSARLVETQEQERRAIARELHDEIGQTMSALLVDLGNLSAVTACSDDRSRTLLTSIRKLVEGTVHSLRNMALLLRPSMLDDLGLVPALEWQAREVSRRTGMRVDIRAQDVADELPEEHRTCIYRVVQEALHNCSRHAAAHNVRVSVRQKSEEILLEIYDDGRGFDSARVRGLGLLGMEERAEHLGGSFGVVSRAGTGTTITVQLPLPRSSQVQAVQATYG